MIMEAMLNPWLGTERGHLSDWTTQQWVRRTGAGFYFVVRDGAAAWAKTVPAMTEEIHVYVGEGELRTDHTVRIWGRTFLRLHYAMRRA